MYSSVPSQDSRLRELLLTFLSPFVTISLCMACHYFRHPVFSMLCHVFSQLVCLDMALFMLSLRLFFGRSLLPLTDTSSLNDFAHIMWLCSRIKQWPIHFSLLFSRKEQTCFTCTSFPTSSFLMWSTLVVPLVHLNILISDVVHPGRPSCPSQHPHFG